MKNYSRVILAISTLLFSGSELLALGNSTQSNNKAKGVEITIEDVKRNYVNITHAAYKDSLNTAIALQKAINIFLATPTDANLKTAREAYKTSRLPYQQSEIARFDTPITLQANLGSDGGPASVDNWEGQVNAWPLDENFIIRIIKGNQAISKALLISQNGAQDNEANVTTGIHAIEFMLWGKDTNGTGPGAGNRLATDFANNNCLDDLCERRAQYLKVVSDLLVEDLSIMTSEWNYAAQTTQGTLAHNFLNNKDSLAYVVSAMTVMATDELASARMSSGLQLGDPEESHDCFSDLSHIAIYGNFLGVQNAFYGNYGNVSGASLAQLVNQLDTTTHDNIVAALDEVEALMVQIKDAGERKVNSVRYDQIIGQGSNGAEKIIAESAIKKLIALEFQFQSINEILSLASIDSSGSGDGD